MDRVDMEKRAEWGGLFAHLLREGVRRRDWSLVDQAMAAQAGALSEEEAKRLVLVTLSRNAESWYRQDVAWCADAVVRAWDPADTKERFREAVTDAVSGWTHGDGWTALAAVGRGTYDAALYVATGMRRDVEALLETRGYVQGVKTTVACEGCATQVARVAVRWLKEDKGAHVEVASDEGGAFCEDCADKLVA